MRKYTSTIILVAFIIFLAISCKKHPPIASFTFNSSTVEIGDTVYFVNTSQDAVNFNWDFGDGDQSTEENPSHIYEQTGIYTVTLTATNADGSDETSRSLSILPPSGNVIQTTVYSPGLEGNLLEDSPTQNVSIYLPPGYESSEKNYPVVYLLHGYPDDDRYEYPDEDRYWFGKNSENYSVEILINQLIYDGTIEPMILVSPNSKNRFGGSFYTNSIVTGNWEDYIVNDVVQFIDNNYRTISNSDSRGIMGVSLGGYGVVMFAMKHPEIFSAAFALSSWGLAFEYDFGSRCTWVSEMKSEFEEIAACKTLSDFNTLPVWAQIYVAASAAMAPNPSAPPFYFDPLYNSNGEKVDSVLQRFYAHDPSRLILIDEYKENLMQLNAFKFECGIHDEVRGIYTGNTYFEGILKSIGIENAFEPFDGDHTNKIIERLDSIVFPFFSEHLVHEN